MYHQKCSASIICKPISNVINKIINTTNLFPDSFKLAQVTPVFNKDHPFILKNYKPVICQCQNLKKTKNEQLNNHFENIIIII
jgi:hypothetical protein